jgi:hypothetical protein
VQGSKSFDCAIDGALDGGGIGDVGGEETCAISELGCKPPTELFIAVEDDRASSGIEDHLHRRSAES